MSYMPTRRTRRRWPFGSMEVGDSIEISASDLDIAHVCASKWKTRTGREFTVHKLSPLMAVIRRVK